MWMERARLVTSSEELRLEQRWKDLNVLGFDIPDCVTFIPRCLCTLDA